MDTNITRTLLILKEELDFTKLIPIVDLSQKDSNLQFGKIVISSNNSNRRIEEKCEVRYYLQKYVFNLEENSFKVFNKDYKNPYKRGIDNIKVDESQIRKCLLNCYDSEIVLFVVPKELDKSQWIYAVKDLKITEENLKNYEDKIYYKFMIESVIFPVPAEPKSLQLYDKYIKKFQDEIRYFISKEIYTEGEKWTNQILTKFFNMSNELKKQMTDDLKKKLLPEMKGIILNKTLCLMKKPNNETKHKDYEQIVKIVTTEYYKHFPIKDDKYFKISYRLAYSYFKLKNLDNCILVLKELQEINKDDPEVNKLYQEVTGHKKENQTKTKKNIYEFFNSKDSQNDLINEQAFTWDLADEDLDLKCNLNVSVINALTSSY